MTHIRRGARRLLRSVIGSSDLTVYMLLTAAGAAMVGITVPSLFRSSDSAARTFQNQVNVLERGTATGGGVTGGGTSGGSLGLGGWSFSFGSKGASITTGGGALGSESVSVGSGGTTIGNGTVAPVTGQQRLVSP